MHISKIKTEEDFNRFADIQYQRTHKLREIWQNTEEDEYRRERAFRLFSVMALRVTNLGQVLLKIRNKQTERFAETFEAGGVFIPKNNNN